MSHKYKLTLPGPLAEQLQELAVAAELAPSTFAGQFVASEVAPRARCARYPDPCTGTPSSFGSSEVATMIALR
jgi:hypothetical protein